MVAVQALRGSASLSKETRSLSSGKRRVSVSMGGMQRKNMMCRVAPHASSKNISCKLKEEHLVRHDKKMKSFQPYCFFSLPTQHNHQQKEPASKEQDLNVYSLFPQRYGQQN